MHYLRKIQKLMKEVGHHSTPIVGQNSNLIHTFARLEMGQYSSSSTLQENIKPLSEETWEAIHHCLMQYAKKTGIETGQKIRIDSTAIDSDVHDPTDASLLWDGVRIITRWLEEGHTGSSNFFKNHK
jgi:IS5 family transposase